MFAVGRPVTTVPNNRRRHHHMTTIQSPVDNGVNVEALIGVRDALPDAPEIAQFQWRSTTSWVNGTHSRSDVETFYGFGEEQRHRATFSYDVDHPLQFAAQDNGVTPVEFVLVALGGCLTAGIAAVAQQRGIQLRSVQAVAAVVAQSQKRSAVYDILTNPTAVTVTVS